MASISAADYLRSTWRVALVAAAFVGLCQGMASACDQRIYRSCQARAYQRQAPFAQRPDRRRRQPRHHRSTEPTRARRHKPSPPRAAIATNDPGVTVPVMAMTEPPTKAAQPPMAAETPTKAAEPPTKAAEPPTKAAEPPTKAAEPPIK